MILRSLAVLSVLMFLAACDGESKAEFPEDQERDLKLSRGRLTGDGLTLGGDDDEDSGGQSPIGVNSFLWRATLDTLSFVPLVSADPFGGVIITDWYEDPKTPGERFKFNALILDRSLRADGIKLTAFKQVKDPSNTWVDAELNPSVARDIENTILTRARQLRIAQDTN